MTEKIKGLTIVLGQDYKEDDCEAIISAISMIKGVLKVIPVVVDNSDDYINRERMKHEMKMKILSVIKDY